MPQNGEIYGTYDFPGNTGDGYLLGYRAAAKLTSMEYTMCYVILKDVETPGTAMMIEKGAKIIDAAGNALFEEGFYDLSEVNRIQNSPAGPLRLRLRSKTPCRAHPTIGSRGQMYCPPNT